jgi:hypothetical protein
VNHWLGRIPPEISVRNIHLPLAWLYAAPPWLLLAALIVLIGNAVPLLLGAKSDRAHSAPAAAMAILAYFLLLALLTLAAAAASLALLRVGVAIVRPKIPLGNRPQAAVNAYAWAIADGLPGPSIPTTLHWTLQYRFVDRWSEALLLLYKIAFITVLLFPVYRIVRVYAEWSRPPANIEPSLSAARQFLGRLLDARTALERLEGWSISAGPQKESWSFVYFAARRALDDLESALEGVRLLFGDGDVTSKADAAEAVARNRFERSTMTSYGGEFSSLPIDLDESQLTLNRSISEYSWSANEALYTAAGEQLYRTE